MSEPYGRWKTLALTLDLAYGYRMIPEDDRVSGSSNVLTLLEQSERYGLV